MLDGLRYGLALLLVILLPPTYAFWLVVHPFIGFWRRLGPAATYATIGIAYALAVVALYCVRAPLLAVEFGTQPVLLVLGLACLVASVPLRLALRRRLSVGALVGLPELAPARHPQSLITDGVYARIRHPRYVEGTIGMIGCALVANYLAPYLIVAASIPVIYAIVRVEERELRDRFGAEYEAYCRRVPRFVPRLGGTGKR